MIACGDSSHPLPAGTSCAPYPSHWAVGRGPIVNAGPLWGARLANLWQRFRAVPCLCKEDSWQPGHNADAEPHLLGITWFLTEAVCLPTSCYSCWMMKNSMLERGQKYKRAWCKDWRKIKKMKTTERIWQLQQLYWKGNWASEVWLREGAYSLFSGPGELGDMLLLFLRNVDQKLTSLIVILGMARWYLLLRICICNCW